MALPLGDLLRMGAGMAHYCLVPSAADALEGAGIALRAAAPAELTTREGMSCVSAKIVGGSFSPDFTKGEISFDGGFEFAHEDGRRLVMTGLKGDVPTGLISADVHGAEERRSEVLSFAIDPARMQLGPAELKAHIAFTLTDGGAAAFRSVFGVVPIPSGGEMFDGHGIAAITAAGVRL
ncbi:hypothetical protein ACIG3E_36675 [Streptomyces sp. NPDC053474]|uniref:hypothetical protein n=1 Tax=Streptomyces sp. NPDC053474 TaxID=3365704 RepID=UPI0037D0923B